MDPVLADLPVRSPAGTAAGSWWRRWAGARWPPSHVADVPPQGVGPEPGQLDGGVGVERESEELRGRRPASLEAKGLDERGGARDVAEGGHVEVGHAGLGVAAEALAHGVLVADDRDVTGPAAPSRSSMARYEGSVP